MIVRVGFVIACAVLVMVWLTDKMGRPLAGRDVYVGGAGFWFVTLGGALLLNAIF